MDRISDPPKQQSLPISAALRFGRLFPSVISWIPFSVLQSFRKFFTHIRSSDLPHTIPHDRAAAGYTIGYTRKNMYEKSFSAQMLPPQKGIA